MKHFIAVLFLFVPFSFALAQIPNAGFESWTSGQPDDWFTTNVNGIVAPVIQSSTAFAGSSSLCGTVIAYATYIFPPVIKAGTTGQGFSVSQRYAAFTGNYQFTPVGGDELLIYSLMSKGGTTIAAGTITIADATSGWQTFNIPYNYPTSDVPDLCTIQFTLVPNGAAYHVGSSMLIDNLAFSNATGVGKGPAGLPKNFALMQNYPNPFNPSTTIAFDLPVQSQVTLKLYDLLGREVAVLFQNQIMQAGSHSTQWNASAQPSGVYFVRLTAGNFSAMRKLILLK
jgi:hypothetical protein